MAEYRPNTRGDLDDRVRLLLGSEELLITEGYDFRQGVLTQPSAFSLRLGHGSVVRELTERYSPNEAFQLYIGEALRCSGFIDALILSGEAGATELTVNGRDTLARLHDACIKADKTYTNKTYGDLVFTVIKDALGEATVIATENIDNRLTQAGLRGAATAGTSTKKDDPPDPDESEEDRKKRQAASKSQNAQGAMQAKAGERYYDFLKKELDRAGLCLWATADGEAYVLAAPDGQQAPIARLVRKRGTSGNLVNVLSARYTNDTSKRFSEVIVYARGGGGKTGRTTSSATYEDAEMKALGFDRPQVIRDTKCTTAKQADFLARRKMAESRRAGFNLTYVVAGHTFPTLGTGERGVWTPDTVVDVDDDEFGLFGSFYVEQVAFRRQPQTTTELTLLRPSDLVFAEDPPT